ncbi:MAG: nickel pincer cofactor biosynthesis protein LarB [Candidatus Omnitrophica bacterium]|nr:nickel pincer cofactor biosynthesis protein LarB [Candidatus Omnitrophota bacterium]
MAHHKGFCDLGFAKVDTDRCSRRGFAEAIYSPGKTKEHLKKISLALLKKKQDLILTRLEIKVYLYLKKSIPGLKYNPTARIAYRCLGKKNPKPGIVLVVSAGTADLPVAEEAAQTVEALGNKVERLYDVGVAGVHRLMYNAQALKSAAVIIVVAGMEGALASLVSGMVSVPVVAVPTSCGYGASFSGLSALLTMLNGCSPGVAVVNIDNGFGAGYLAGLINK